MGMAVEALSLVSAPSQAAASAIGSVAEVKSKLQGCVASLVALDTVWEVGKATYLPELAGYAATDLSSLETVSVQVTAGFTLSASSMRLISARGPSSKKLSQLSFLLCLSNSVLSLHISIDRWAYIAIPQMIIFVAYESR